MHFPTMFVSCNFKSIRNYNGRFDELCADAEYGDVLYIPELGGHYVFLSAIKGIIRPQGDSSKSYYESIVLGDFNDFMNARCIKPERSVKKLMKQSFLTARREIELFKFKPQKRIIAFMGQMGSGKSMAANIASSVVQMSYKIANKEYPQVNRISFADSLRDCCAKLLILFDVEKECDYIDLSHEDGRHYYGYYLKESNLKSSRIYGLKEEFLPAFHQDDIDSIDYSLDGIIYQSMLKLINTLGEDDMPLEETPIFEAMVSQQHIISGIIRFLRQFSDMCKTNEFTVRNFLQLFGTDFVRDTIDKSFHTNRVKAEIIREFYRSAKSGHSPIYFFLDDVRFENEAELIKSMGGLVIGIKRDNTNKNSSHPSEQTSRQSWDTMASITIDNNGSLDDLRSKINETLKELPGYLGS